MLRRSLVLAALAGALAAPSVAHADAFDDVFADYQKDSRIAPCDHTQDELERAQAELPRDIRQYAPDFPAALKKALEERPGANCSEEAPAPVARVPTTPAPAPEAAPPAQQAPPVVTTRKVITDDAPAPRIVLAVLGGLLVLALLLWALARFFVWEPRWLAGARHATAEAGWRASGAWEDFTDWLRGGRASSPG